MHSNNSLPEGNQNTGTLNSAVLASFFVLKTFILICTLPCAYRSTHWTPTDSVKDVMIVTSYTLELHYYFWTLNVVLCALLEWGKTLTLVPGLYVFKKGDCRIRMMYIELVFSHCFLHIFFMFLMYYYIHFWRGQYVQRHEQCSSIQHNIHVTGIAQFNFDLDGIWQNRASSFEMRGASTNDNLYCPSIEKSHRPYVRLSFCLSPSLLFSHVNEMIYTRSTNVYVL